MRIIALQNVFKKPYQHRISYVIHIIHLLDTYLFKVGFPPSLTLVAIFFAIVSLKYGYKCIILDFLPREEYLSSSISLKVGESYRADYACTIFFQVPRSTHGPELRNVPSLTR